MTRASHVLYIYEKGIVASSMSVIIFGILSEQRGAVLVEIMVGSPRNAGLRVGLGGDLGCEVWNLDGGIDAWSETVDSTVPRY